MLKILHIISNFALIVLILNSHNCFAQANLEEPITINNGLINNEVTAIHQDKYGFLWFGTRGGLDRYDGYDFKLIGHNPQLKNTLTNQSVEVIAEDKFQDILWIGTKNGGLNSYNLLTDSVSIYHPPLNIKIQEIKCLAVDKSGTLFIGALNGFYCYKKGKFEIINDHQLTNAVKIDSKGRVWVGTSNGLFLYNYQSNKLNSVKLNFDNVDITSIAINNLTQTLYFGTWKKGLIKYQINTTETTQFLHKSDDVKSISNNNTYRVFLDSNKNLWVGTWGGGLNKFDDKSQTFKHINIKPDGIYNLDYDVILSIIQDRSGVIWIGLDGGGVCKINSSSHGFKNITYSVSSPNNLLNTHIKSVFQDSKRRLWLGTKGSGLFYSTDKLFFLHQKPPPSGFVNAFFENNQKDLWVGSSDGLSIYRDFYKRLSPPLQVVNKLNDTSSLSGPQVSAIVKDRDNTIWVGTQEQGLNKLLSIQNGKFCFKRYTAKIGTKGALQNERISCLLVDYKNRLWIGTYGGLYLYNRDKDNFSLFRAHVNWKNTLSNNTIISLAQDHKGNIWIGTEQGLNELLFNDIHHYTFKRYFESTGFPNDYIHAVQVDRFDNIWMSTNSGITELKAETQTFLNFDNENGVSFNTFAQNSSFLARDGEIFFGGPSGLTYFYPDSIFLNKFKPNVFITDLKVNNTDVSVGQNIKGDKILSKSLFVTDKITLSYKEDIFSLTFASLDYHASSRNQYQYRLQGFNENWINADKNRTVTYTNLSPGTYIFEVRGTNSDQIWNAKSVSLEINVLPPPWKTWWAYTLYYLIIVFGLWLSRHIKLNRLNLENKLQLADLNYKKEHEITEFKSKLFSNISHEFRTPLSLIIGPIEGLLESEKLDSSVSNVLYNVQSQSKRLLSLVTQFLDFNKAESNALKLNAVKQDIVPIFKNIYNSFVFEADRKKIKFLFEANKEQIFLEIDKDKIESIVYNLLSNAFKFTPNGGEISFKVLLKENESICEFLILDSGKGISANDKVKVFNRFYQVSQAEPGQYAGTGIGLAFVKDLVELHKGTIDIEDNTPTGTIFKIILPAVNSGKGGEQLDQFIAYEEMAVEDHPSVTNENEDLPIILIVEDNEELNYYISETLKPIGKVISARNGKEGLAQSLNIIPDLIVSDIMMPELNGYQLAEALKSDIRTSHIPIILLTAKSDEPSYVEGLRLGADMYLTKPFSPRILISHVKNLIQSRKVLKVLFAQQLRIEPNEIAVISFEEEFIKKLIDYIEEHISEDELSIDKMADHVFMSRSTLYRKLKALTGMSISDFVRLIKLKRSAQFLATGKYTVNMAAFEAGFNDLKYFRKVFQNQFGINPSEYLKREKSKSNTTI